MYSYKINNFNTIYVCTEYINDCMRASKRSGSSGKKKACRTYSTNTNAKNIPLPLETQVNHKQWGMGSLIAKESHGIMTIAFSDRLVKFIYPDAFAQGHLVRT